MVEVFVLNIYIMGGEILLIYRYIGICGVLEKYDSIPNQIWRNVRLQSNSRKDR